MLSWWDGMGMGEDRDDDAVLHSERLLSFRASQVALDRGMLLYHLRNLYTAFEIRPLGYPADEGVHSSNDTVRQKECSCVMVMLVFGYSVFKSR